LKNYRKSHFESKNLRENLRDINPRKKSEFERRRGKRECRGHEKIYLQPICQGENGTL